MEGNERAMEGLERAIAKFIQKIHPNNNDNGSQAGRDEQRNLEVGKRKCTILQFHKFRPPEFDGTANPRDAESWIIKMGDLFGILQYTDEQKVSFAAFKLKDDAYHWWLLVKQKEPHMNWRRFQEVFYEMFIPESFRLRKIKEFVSLEPEMCHNNNDNGSQAGRDQQRNQEVGQSTICQFLKLGPPEFDGIADIINPIAAESWMMQMEKVFSVLPCTDEQKVSFSAFKLKDNAYHWWLLVKQKEPHINWQRFQEVFSKKYIRFPESYRLQKIKEFVNLEQGSMTVFQYSAKFIGLAYYAPVIIDTEVKKARKFENGLRWNIKHEINVLELQTYAEVLDRASIAEKYSEENFEIHNKKRKNTGSSKQKRVDQGTEPNFNSPKRQKMYIPNLESFRLQKIKEFANLEQGSMTVAQYSAKFIELAYYAPFMIDTEVMKARKFESGLRWNIKHQIYVLGLQTYVEVLDRGLIVEKYINDKKRKNSESRRLKRVDWGTEPNFNSLKRWNMYTRVSSAASTPQTGRCNQRSDNYPHCPTCQTFHLGTCLRGSGNCYRCGKPGHHKKDCPVSKQNVDNSVSSASAQVEPVLQSEQEKKEQKRQGGVFMLVPESTHAANFGVVGDAD